MKFGRTTYGGDRPVCSQQPIMVTGGFNLDQSANSFTEGTVIPAGTLVTYDEITRKVKVLKSAKVEAIDGGDAKIVTLVCNQYLKPNFIVGDSVLKTVSGNFSAAPTITGISTTGGTFIITLSAEISGLEPGDTLVQVISDGGTPTPQATLIASSFQAAMIADAEVKASTVETGIDITIDTGPGAFYLNRIPAIVSTLLTGAVLKDNPNVKFTKSY